MEDNKMQELKEEYLKTPIPEKLDTLVKDTFNSIKNQDLILSETSQVNRGKMASVNKYKWISAIAASILIFTLSINFSPAFANALYDIPFVGSLVRVLTVKEYKIDEETFDADIKTPMIEGLENEELQNSLNEKYYEENKKLYEDFMADIAELKENGGGHMGLDSGYVIKTDNEKILSIGRYVVNIVASSSTVFKYDTIDKQREVLITLPSLFKDESYSDIISQNIKEQMRDEMKKDENKIYWLEDSDLEEIIDPFHSISKDQSFYIDENYKLVISFDKYEVAPGYMGVIEFVIPTELIRDSLVSDEYIK